VLHRQLLGSPEDVAFPWALATLGVDVVIIFYLMQSRLVRDVFADFPEDADSVVSKVLPNAGEVKVDVQADQLQSEVIAGSRALVIGPLAVQNAEQAMAVAAAYVVKNSLGEAEQTYRQLLETWPEFAPAWHALGLLAVQTNNLKQAAVLVRQAAALDGGNALYQRNMGEIFRRLGRLAEAIHAGKEATRLQPDDADAHFNLALALADARRNKEAIASYRATVHLNVAHGQAWNNIGMLLRQQGSHVVAKYAFEQALIINPDHAEALSSMRFYSQKVTGP
jgi:tetratricopeptide (TPR) repeat protein